MRRVWPLSQLLHGTFASLRNCRTRTHTASPCPLRSDTDGLCAIAAKQQPAEPGILLRSESFATAVPADARAWRILYTTTRADDSPAVGSAVVVASRRAASGPRAYPEIDAGIYAKARARLLAKDISSRCVGGWGTLLSVFETALLPSDGIFVHDPVDGPLGERLLQNAQYGLIPACPDRSRADRRPRAARCPAALRCGTLCGRPAD